MIKQTGLPAGILDVQSLPALPQTLVELIDACGRKDANINELGMIVARDVTVSAKVLQLVNSAFIGARSTFSDIIQAVIYLGVDTTRNLAISVAVHETFKSTDRETAICLPEFWSHCLLTAVVAKGMAQLTGKASSSEAYLTGLLHDIGKLLLLNGFPDRYPEILRQQEGGSLERLEKDILGVTHSEAAAQLIESWRLQPEIAAAVACHHRGYGRIIEESFLAKILYGADQLSHCPLPDITAVAQSVCTLLAVEHRTLVAGTKDAQATVAEIAGHMGIRMGRTAAPGKPPAQNRPRAEEKLACRVLSFSRLHGLLDNLVKAESLDRTFQVFEESLHLLFSFDGCLFLLPGDATGATLAAHGSARNPVYRKVEDLRLHADALPALLRDCLERHRVTDSFSYAAEHGLGPVEQSLLEVLQTEGLAAVPVLAAGSAPGLLVIGILPADVKRLRDHESTLLLLAGHAAMRFRLENTYQKHAEELAAARVAAVAEVARAIAHEVSNPIAVLRNYLAVLGVKLEGFPAVAADLESIDREIGRIGQISEQLRDLSGQVTALATEPVDLHILIADVSTFFRQALVRRGGIDLGAGLAPGLPTVLSNGTKIRQILGNLIKNAIEAIEDQGVIRITARTADRHIADRPAVVIAVEDDGPGVAYPHIEDVFLAGVTTKKDGHAGLGLAIVRKLAAELGGSVSCVRKQPRGTIFSFTLPT